jgi:O-antigen/teichoic acid export membrane protein
MSEESQASNDASLRRGSTRLFAAKVFFIGAGLVQQVLLPNTLGLAGYGLLSRVLAPMNVVNNVAVGASMQNASRSTAAGAPPLATILRVQIAIALAVVAALIAAAPAVASFQSAPAIVAPLRLGAVLCGLYVVYATLVGVVNGRQAFAAQAGLDVTAATLRTGGLVLGGVLGARVLGSGPLGAVAGTVLAGAAMVAIATALVKPRGLVASRGEGAAIVLRSVAMLAGAQLVTNTLLQVDVVLLGRVFAVRGVPSVDADRAIGVYRACQLFSLLPYQLVASVSLTLFPLVAKIHAEGSAEDLRALVRRGLRLGVLLATILVGVVVAIPGPLLRLTFGHEVAALGVHVLRPLAGAQALLVVGALASTVLVALGQTKRATLAGASGLAVIGAGVLGAGPGPDALRGMALWLAAGFGVQLILAFAFLLRTVPESLPLATFARAALVAALAAELPSSPSGARMAALALAPVAGASVLAVLALAGEWTRADYTFMANTLRQRLRRGARP